MEMNGRLRTCAAEALVPVILMFVLFCSVSATNHTVGGTGGWDIQSDIQSWLAGRKFFQEDILVFVYSPIHNVLEVDEGAFSSCDANHPLRTHGDGETLIRLPQSGTRYFICGKSNHCSSGMKLKIDVDPVRGDDDNGAEQDPEDQDDGDGPESRGRPPRRQPSPSRQPPPSSERQHLHDDHDSAAPPHDTPRSSAVAARYSAWSPAFLISVLIRICFMGVAAVHLLEVTGVFLLSSASLRI